MLLPSIKRGIGRTRLAGLFLRGAPAERLMNATAVVSDVGADRFVTNLPGFSCLSPTPRKPTILGTLQSSEMCQSSCGARVNVKSVPTS